MTDQIDQITDTDVDDVGSDAPGRNRRRMFIAGAGLAGAAAIVGKSGTAGAVSEPVDTEMDNASTLTTSITNSGTSTDRTSNAFKGVISNADNNSHSILGTTVGGGHAIAGVIGTADPDGTNIQFPDPTVAATWGRHYGPAAAVEGQQLAEGVAVAGPANAVKGIIEKDSNGSHAVLGTTVGGGHAIAGVIGSQTDVNDDTTISFPDSTVAATWGRHYGTAAAVEGQQLAVGVAIAGSANAVKGRIDKPTNGSHAVLGTTNGGGHSVAGDTPADAKGPNGVGPNTTAATWGRHMGVGAGIGGISVSGYGGEFVGGKASARLIPSAGVAVGAPTNDGHLRGELYVDGAGELFYNTSDGNNWVPLTQGGAGGTVLFENPSRASDTRAGSTPPNTDKTKYGLAETRSVNLTLAGYPAGATAALINLTVVNSEGFRGFATVFNGDTADSARPNTSNINWTASTGVIANSATVRPNAAGVIKIYTSQPTDVIVDVQGYIA